MNITKQQAIAVALGMLSFFLAFASFAAGPEELSDSERALFKCGLFISVSLFIATIIWHFKATSHSRNIHPDVLGSLLSADQLFQQGPLQFSFFIFNDNDYLGIRVIMQNTLNSECSVNLSFEQPFISELTTSLSSAAVVSADFLFPGEAYQNTHYLKIKVKATSDNYEQIRFNRRQAIDTEINAAQTGLAALAGYAYFGGGISFKVDLSSIEPPEFNNENSGMWRFKELWQPNKKQTRDSVISLLET